MASASFQGKPPRSAPAGIMQMISCQDLGISQKILGPGPSLDSAHAHRSHACILRIIWYPSGRLLLKQPWVRELPLKIVLGMASCCTHLFIHAAHCMLCWAC